MSKTYKIAEACRALDVQPYVLRYWETEFEALGGKKPGPQRAYSEKELSILQEIKRLLYDEGYTIAGAKKRLDVDVIAEPEVAAQSAKPSAKKAVSSAKTSSGAKTKRKEPASKSVGTKKDSPAKDRGVQPSAQEAVPVAEPATESLDRKGSRSIESFRGELERLHEEAIQLLALVRAGKGR